SENAAALRLCCANRDLGAVTTTNRHTESREDEDVSTAAFLQLTRISIAKRANFARLAPQFGMLIEFSVENYRSFRERQTFSMVAAPRLHKKENTFVPDLLGIKFPPLLKVAVIYGPNASGKSNLLRALWVIELMLGREPTSTLTLPVSPFRFDPALSTKPSVFEIHFIAEQVRYIFEASATQSRIFSERLTAFPKGKEQLLFDRTHQSESDVYSFGPSLVSEAGQSLLDTWTKLTPPRSLFLAQAVGNSSESMKLLRPAFEWLRDGMRFLIGSMSGMADQSQSLIGDSPIHGKDLAEFLRDVDVPISHIRVHKLKFPPSARALMSNVLIAQLAGAANGDELAEVTRNQTMFTHQTALGEADIAFQDESEGTKNLVGLWLPWSLRVPKRIGVSGGVMVVDELDSSLHPNIVSALIKRQIDAEQSSQLIFTTHDTHLMDAKILRRDQFWITERDTNGATRLRSVHDFEGRASEDIEKRYYEGRYRGLPFVKQ
ncbi:AAA family ATPase, partial [Variovorax sp. RTB1]